MFITTGVFLLYAFGSHLCRFGFINGQTVFCSFVCRNLSQHAICR